MKIGGNKRWCDKLHVSHTATLYSGRVLITMSLVKITFLACVAWGTHVTLTPPNPPPSTNERLPPRGLESIATPSSYIAKVRVSDDCHFIH